MTFFVDANVLVYAATESEYRGPCLEIIEAVAGVTLIAVAQTKKRGVFSR